MAGVVSGASPTSGMAALGRPVVVVLVVLVVLVKGWLETRFSGPACWKQPAATLVHASSSRGIPMRRTERPNWRVVFES